MLKLGRPFSSAHKLSVGEDQLVRCVSLKGGISVKVLSATAMIREITVRHACNPLGAVALGRLVLGNVLIAAGSQAEEVVQVQIDGDGILGVICSEAVTDQNGAPL